MFKHGAEDHAARARSRAPQRAPEHAAPDAPVAFPQLRAGTRSALASGMSLVAKALIGISAAAAAVSLVRALRKPERPFMEQLQPEIALDDDYDVTFWMRRLHVSKRQLIDAVRSVGADSGRVQTYLAAH